MLGWHDPRRPAAGGIREGFERSRGVDAETACAGRYVVCTTAPWPPGNEVEAALTVHDTAQQQVSAHLPIPGQSREESTLVEWRSGRIVGYIREASGDYLFYLLDVAVQELTRGLRYAGDVHGKLLVLPNGRVGFLDGETVHQLDTERWETKQLGRLPRPPRDWMRLGESLYLILDTQLARIEGLGVA